MVTSEERMKILKMIAEGKITAEEGAELLETLESSTGGPGQPGSEPGTVQTNAGKKPGRWFRVVVTDTNSGKTRVNVRLPVGLINTGLKMGAKFVPEVEGMDMNQLIEFIKSGEIGQVVDVYDQEDGEHVEVYIE
ncbi:MAG TPA: hypothetical protein VMT46_10480 [Anaerolineaceae bacterium]|nr:hypothetical protein [Anaerolineaceae bacterium]